MGEYATIDGTEIKLGTCEEWTYVRRDEVERWVKQGKGGEGSSTRHGNRSLARLLNEPRIQWRFPYPWEDYATAKDVAERDMFYGVVLGLPHEIKINHGHRTVSMSPSCGAWNVNVSIPCPFNLSHARGDKLPGSAYLRSALPSSVPAQVLGDITHAGERATLFRCGYCESRFVLDGDELAAVREHLKDGNHSIVAARFRGIRS